MPEIVEQVGATVCGPAAASRIFCLLWTQRDGPACERSAKRTCCRTAFYLTPSKVAGLRKRVRTSAILASSDSKHPQMKRTRAGKSSTTANKSRKQSRRSDTSADHIANPRDAEEESVVARTDALGDDAALQMDLYSEREDGASSEPASEDRESEGAQLSEGIEPKGKLPRSLSEAKVKAARDAAERKGEVQLFLAHCNTRPCMGFLVKMLRLAGVIYLSRIPPHLVRPCLSRLSRLASSIYKYL